MHARPVLYLDLDDTLVSWEGGRPHAAPGGGEFLRWALERFEVRWLTTWCPDGSMTPELLRDLSRMVEIPVATLEQITGADWQASGCKLDGIAWLEHVVMDRPFFWLEDEKGVGEREITFLAEHGFLDRYRFCNVTRDPGAIQRLHRELAEEWGKKVAVSG